MRIIRLIKKKIIAKRGETLVETLYSLLIIVPAMVMLAGAIVTAARINNEVRSSDASTLPKLTYNSPVSIDGATNTISGTGVGSGSEAFAYSKNIKWYKESDSIYYYFGPSK